MVGSVFAEEMLHLLLAANLLNAVGGAPVLDAPHLLPSYPHPLPHGDGSLRIGLHPFGTARTGQSRIRDTSGGTTAASGN